MKNISEHHKINRVCMRELLFQEALLQVRSKEAQGISRTCRGTRAPSPPARPPARAWGACHAADMPTGNSSKLPSLTKWLFLLKY